MKLSEAMINGCIGTKQHYHSYHCKYEYDADGNIIVGDYYCALGAAGHGYGLSAAQITQPVLCDLFPVLDYRVEPPPGFPLYKRKLSVSSIIVFLNDGLKWPRLSIAEWLANVVEPEWEAK